MHTLLALAIGHAWSTLKTKKMFARTQIPANPVVDRPLQNGMPIPGEVRPTDDLPGRVALCKSVEKVLLQSEIILDEKGIRFSGLSTVARLRSRVAFVIKGVGVRVAFELAADS